ncbi:MAG: hypothetical protein AAFU61_04580 [Pseudomonadota bacterium]
MKTLRDGYAAHGATPGNARWSWAAWSERFDCLVATVWRDSWIGDEKVFEMQPHLDHNGGRERAQLLGRVKVGDSVRVIYCVASDETAVPRSIRECWADDRPFIVATTDGEGGFALRPEPQSGRLELLA